MSDIVNLKEISERFNNGTETIEDIINYCRNYEITFGYNATMRVVEKKYFDKLVKKIQELEEENSNLKIENNFKIVGSYGEVKLEEILKEDYIPKQKVKDKIEHYKELQNNYIKKYDEVNDTLQGMINILQELLEDK